MSLALDLWGTGRWEGCCRPSAGGWPPPLSSARMESGIPPCKPSHLGEARSKGSPLGPLKSSPFSPTGSVLPPLDCPESAEEGTHPSQARGTRPDPPTEEGKVGPSLCDGVPVSVTH